MHGHKQINIASAADIKQPVSNASPPLAVPSNAADTPAPSAAASAGGGGAGAGAGTMSSSAGGSAPQTDQKSGASFSALRVFNCETEKDARDFDGQCVNRYV